MPEQKILMNVFYMKSSQKRDPHDKPSSFAASLFRNRIDVDDRSAIAVTVELCDALFGETNLTCNSCVYGPILAQVRICTRTELVSLLTNEDFACRYNLATEALYATTLRNGISSVLG